MTDVQTLAIGANGGGGKEIPTMVKERPFGGAALGGPTASSWREQALTRVAEIEDLAEAFTVADPEPSAADSDARMRAVLAARIRRHLDTAREAADGTLPRRGRWARFKALLGGSPLERTASNLDAAEADLLRVAPPDYLEGQLPGLLAHVRAHLAPDDPRRKEMEELCNPGSRGRLTEAERNAVIAAARAASSAARREILQIRSFRNILYICALALTVTVAGLLVLGVLRPRLLPLCFKPTNFAVCPSGVGHVIPQNANEREVDAAVRDAASRWDIPIVAMVGVIAAAISAAVALRKLHGTSTPYALPVALAVLKLPTGALTAVLGLLLMRGGFVPGLSALDNPAQIIAWAILFGYAQQLFTRLVDDRAHDVLNQVGGQERPLEPRPTSGSITGNLSVSARSNGGPGADPSTHENQ
jgi:hypothetical protein